MSLYSRRSFILSAITKEMRGIELGPSYNPLLPKSAGWNIISVDYTTKDTLVEKYKGHPVDVSKIETVDVIWSQQELHKNFSEAGYSNFDFIIASHVIEHIPDLLGFFKSCEILLKPGGFLFLYIPDKRCCFDFFKPLSTTADVVCAWLEKRKRHSCKTVMEHFSYNVDIKQNGKCNMAWSKGQRGSLHFAGQLSVAFKHAVDYQQNTGIYEDYHCWYFIPSSFYLICEELRFLKLLTFLQIESFHATFGFEFFAKLRKAGVASALSPPSDVFDKQRMELLENIMLELTECLPFSKKNPDSLFPCASMHLPLRYRLVDKCAEILKKYLPKEFLTLIKRLLRKYHKNIHLKK